PTLLDQGPDWTPTARRAVYGRDQGSQIMPLRWIAALKQPDGRPFMADSLSRYGYLPNPDSEPPGLPVGFTAGSSGPHGAFIGMTCSACHTRQIEVAGVAYRADGGPAIVDFQSFLADLDVAVKTVLDQPAAFKDFAAAVLGPKAPPPKLAELRSALAAWHLPYHTLMQRALPTPAWGPSRLDAVAMIFNRLAGLDLGPPPTYMIPENIQPADAPVRYPFLWNAAIQDKTQWPGFADNGSPLLGLSRNLGEVFGVFASFKPKRDYWRVLGVNYLHDNSADFSGLRTLEDLIVKIGPPKWPWAVDAALASQGAAIYARSTAQGGCADCHGIKPGVTRFPDHKTWATPIQNVGTDTREYAVLGRQVKTGVLKGAKIPFLTSPLKPVEPAISVLGTAVLGSILQHYVPLVLDADMVARAELSRIEGALEKAPSSLDPKQVEELRGAFHGIKGASSDPSKAAAAAPVNAYEARVLQGIWAAAPYLHNGSVPTLAELLKPADQRVSEFKIGPNYDIQNVGLAAEQTRFNYVLKTTGCNQLDSGSSRCGHEFGTSLPAEEKRALLEYLKTL
ncbi:MAG TPA: di-heme-cytochrome C peroxidase, partial [Burkholderiaceae bacterium]|nr:di-heme-cytochrome C peroxidase [Burkholderiaceae bacterium]